MKAAVLCARRLRNHPLPDGNKRGVGLAARVHRQERILLVAPQRLASATGLSATTGMSLNPASVGHETPIHSVDECSTNPTKIRTYRCRMTCPPFNGSLRVTLRLLAA